MCAAGLLTLTCEYFWKVLVWSYCWCSSLNITQQLVWALVQEWAFLVLEDRSSALRILSPFLPSMPSPFTLAQWNP